MDYSLTSSFDRLLPLDSLPTGDEGFDPTCEEKAGVEEVATPTGGGRLYVDIKSFAHCFFQELDNHPQAVINAPGRIRTFCAAAEKAGLTLAVFVDAVHKTDQAMTKWKMRRGRDLQAGQRGMIQGFIDMMTEAFHRCGVTVHYTVESNNDDALAAFAELDGADVLVAGSEWFRYPGSSFELYHAFHYNAEGDLVLEPYTGKPRRDVEKRQLRLSPRPTTVQGESTGTAWLHELRRDRTYVRGSASPLVRALGMNPHIAVRRLRQALYARVGLPVSATIHEEFPEWSDEEGCTVWRCKETQPDSSLDDLLDRPLDAFTSLFPPGCALLTRPPTCKSSSWRNHLLSLHALVYELCCLASDGRQSLLDLMTQAAQEILLEVPVSPEEEQEEEQARRPGHTYVCVDCGYRATMKAEEVDWFASQRFPLPKRCKRCKSCKNRKMKKTPNLGYPQV